MSPRQQDLPHIVTSSVTVDTFWPSMSGPGSCHPFQKSFVGFPPLEVNGFGTLTVPDAIASHSQSFLQPDASLSSLWT